MEWDELRSHFDRLYNAQALDNGLTEQSIDIYQAELLKLYDRWAGVNTEISLDRDSVCSADAPRGGIRGFWRNELE